MLNSAKFYGCKEIVSGDSGGRDEWAIKLLGASSASLSAPAGRIPVIDISKVDKSKDRGMRVGGNVGERGDDGKAGRKKCVFRFEKK